MASQALKDFDNRLEEVKQLMEAHGALTRIRRAEAALQGGHQNLQNVAQVVQHLVSSPGRGRPAEVHALNSAAIALLSAHLQGFLVDLFKEMAKAILDGVVRDVEAVISAANIRGNPNEHNIVKLFKAIGISDVLSGISWQHMSNQQLRINLRTFNELRNKIVHGSSEHVKKSSVSTYLNIFANFASHIDRKLTPKRRRTFRH
ncbi:MAG TPA: HEPN domain-containing protein [Candidatus Saccharimonadales bacterium]|nr:HEPN domain-containing protein [Candidatus Saccharimonadales bacterium]